MVAKVLKIVPGSDWAKEKLEMTTIGPWVSCTSWLALESSDWIKKKKKKRHKRARTNIYFTSHICSCNCFPVGCFQWRRKPDWTSIQQWIIIPLLEISKFLGENHGVQLTLSMLPWGQQRSQALGFDRMFTDPCKERKMQKISPVNFLRAYVAPDSTTMAKSPARLSCWRRGKPMRK